MYYYSPDGNKVQNSYFDSKGHSQGHIAIEFNVTYRNIISGVRIPNKTPLSITVQKL